MIRKFLPSNEHLKRYVYCFFIVDAENESDNYEPVFPYSRFTLGFHLDSPYVITDSDHQHETKTFCAFSPIGNAVTLVKPTGKHTYTIGAHFYAYSLPKLTKIPASELMATLDPAHIFGRGIHTIQDKLFEARTEYDQLALLEEYLLTKLVYPGIDSLEFAVQQIIRQGGQLNITALADELRLSDRMVRIYFERYVGCSVKTFAKIARFENSFGTNPAESLSLTERALDSGYYDQSHYIRDFKQLTGFNPKYFYKKKERFRFVQF